MKILIAGAALIACACGPSYHIASITSLNNKLIMVAEEKKTQVFFSCEPQGDTALKCKQIPVEFQEQ